MPGPGFDQQITFLYTDDLAAGDRFYGGVLGLPLVLDQGACRIYRAAVEAFIGICSHKGAPSDTSSVIVTLVTPDVDGWYERLRQRGVDFESAPADNETFAIRHCFLRDPAGYLVEIQSFRSPDWPSPAA